MATQIDLGAVVPIGKGDWNIGTTYERANIVRHNSVAWVCKVDSSTGVEPTEDSSDWYLLVKDTSSVTSINGQTGDVNLDIITNEEVDNKISKLESKVNNKIPNIMTGASDEISGKSGLVPQPKAGDENKFLKGDASWGRLSEQPDFVDLADRVTEAESKTGLPLGHFFTWPFSTPPNGSIIVNGATYSRELYADLWAYVSSNSGWIKTESEWQSIASENGGYCPYYSDGDGSTTFRVPKFAPYQQLAISSANAGTYHQAGLPEIGGTVGVVGGTDNDPVYSIRTGVFKNSKATTSTFGALGAGAGPKLLEFNASLYNSHYGRSDTVQPEANEWIVCVVAYGSATNVGNVDVANVMSAVSLAQEKAEEAVEIDSSGYYNGQRYIRFKNGVQFIWVTYFENQSSGRVTFCKSFNNIPCFISFHNSHADYIGSEWAQLTDLTSTYFTVGDWSFGSVYKNGDWLAIGTWK